MPDRPSRQQARATGLLVGQVTHCGEQGGMRLVASFDRD
jgi:hypothetical protein